MTDRPIIFSEPMVRALLDGRKTQTRRVLKPQPPGDCAIACIASNGAGWAAFDGMGNGFALSVAFAPGDRLWVRETFAIIGDETTGPIYRVNHDGHADRWQPSIHMPRRFSRLTLTVTDVRVHRLQDISEADAAAEGVDAVTMEDVPRQAAMSRRGDFAALWNGLHGPSAWHANPWVVALTFDVKHGNIDAVTT